MLVRLAVLVLAVMAPLQMPFERSRAANAADGAGERAPSFDAVIIDPPRSGPALPAYEKTDARATRRQAPTSASAFELHSDPGSKRTIYLDFDGQRVADTLWNDQEGLPAMTVAGWSLDNDPKFSPTEEAFIHEVWLAVAEDFAPFDVDVTTEDPGPEAIDRSGSGDLVFGTRALITNDDVPLEVICGSECSGVAYPGAFAEKGEHNYLQPAWIFGQIQSSLTPKPVAETISHEVGHQFNLSHDGRDGQDYYKGHSIWAPIMGFSDFEPLTQWSDGAYQGYETDADFQPTRDDIHVIANSGAPERPDEAGGTVATASAVRSGAAYITSRIDQDVWALGTCQGSMSVRAEPAAFAPNLDIELQLLSGSGATLATDNPPSFQDGSNLDTAQGLAAQVQRSSNGEQLFAKVDGVGVGNPSIAYDDFGSVGAYTLSVTGCDGGSDPNPDPDPDVTVPDAPLIGSPVKGAKGRPLTVGIRWSPPTSDGGSGLTGYVIYFDKVDAYGATLKSFYSDPLEPSRRSASFKVGAGLFRFQVVAVNAEGESARSAYSTIVKAR